MWRHRERSVLSILRPGGIGTACGLVTFLVLLGTSPLAPVTWDEGDAIRRAEGIQEWAGDFVASLFGREKELSIPPLSAKGIAQGFPFTTRREGHPAFYGILIAVGEALAPKFFDPLTRYRLGPILVFALAVGVATHRMAYRWGPHAACAAGFALLLQPRLFAHAHYASFDGPLTAFWLLCWATFPAKPPGSSDWTMSRRVPAGIRWGIFLGATMSCKFTGWLAPFPFLVWSVFQRDRRLIAVLTAGLLTAIVTFFILNPPLWFDPWHGWLTFFRLNLCRRQNPGLNITTYFLGRMYNLDYPLPWYNTLFWTLVVVPVPILVLFLIGLASLSNCRNRETSGLLAANWATLILVRSFPGVPPHDGIRLFLPAFAFLGLVAGAGLAYVQKVLSRGGPDDSEKRPEDSAPSQEQERRPRGFSGSVCWPGWSRRLPRPLRLVVIGFLWAGLASCALPMCCFAPQWLSYYNLFIGGLRGAAQRGMEPTYYWDALDREVFLWLRIHCVPGDEVYFSAGSYDNLELQYAWGWLPAKPAAAPADARWYIIQHRPSAWSPLDAWLAHHGEPAFVKYAGQGPSCPLTGKVWLIKIFPIFEFWRANHAMLDQTGKKTSYPAGTSDRKKTA